MEKKKRKYSFDEKEKLARLCAKYKEEYDNHETVEKYDPKKRKFTKSRVSSGFLSKAVREMYPSMKEKPSDSPDFKKAIHLARRSYNSYIDEENQENFVPLRKRSSVKLVVGENLLLWRLVRQGLCVAFAYLLCDKKRCHK